MNKCSYKIAVLALAACLSGAAAASAQTVAKPKIYKPDPRTTIMFTALSDNGRYALSVTPGDQEVDNPQPAGGSVMDLTTNTLTNIPAPMGQANVCDVADDGTVVGSNMGRPAVWNPTTESWTTYQVPSNWGGGCFNAVTPDAKIAVGYYTNPNNVYQVHPMAWNIEDDEEIDLTNLPTVDMTGIDQKQNLFYGVTPDGRYALGQMSQSYIMPASLFSYVYDLQNNTWKAIGFDYNALTKTFKPQDPNLYFIDNQTLSPDGKYVTGGAYIVVGMSELEGGREYRCAYRYDIENDIFDLYDDERDKDIIGDQVTPNGTILAHSPSGNPYPDAYVRSGNFFISLDQILQQVYGTTLMREIGDDTSGAFYAISADGLTAIMSHYSNCYIIKMNEPFDQAAARVDLLGNYSAAPADGAVMNRITEIKLTFDRAVTCINNPSTIKLVKNSDNSVIRTAAASVVSSGSTNQITITFRTQTLDPGESYSVVIPAKYISLRDDTTQKTKEIKINYTGRSADAVKMLSASPASGSHLTQLNPSTEYITLAFDADVAIASGATASLYREGDETPVSTLQFLVNGKRVAVYPTSTVMLYEGTDYRVEIPSGAITDISGAGGCEAITLKYSGAYKRELNENDRYIFNEPCDSYNTFIFFDNNYDKDLTPGSVASQWGFSSDAMNWLLTKSSNESTDWALTSHSMYSTSAQADAWLVTPQLYIPDENAYLAFDAQSYLNARADRLKVYIYSTDEVYNYFNRELVETFRADADLIFDEQLTPGKAQETLEGDYTHYTYGLENYAGKNIYIAFVNDNTDQSAIFLDNIQVVRDLSFFVDNTTAESVVAKNSIPVKGTVTVASEIDTFDGIEVALLDADGNVVDKITDSSSFKYGDSFNFAFTKELPLVQGEINNYSIRVSSGEFSLAFKYVVNDLLYNTTKRVVLEEFTGSDCGNCPLGIQSIEHMVQTYGSRFIPITLRCYNGDFLGNGVTSYCTALGMSAAPSGRINRGDILNPMVSTPDGYKFYGSGLVDSTTGEEIYLWADAVADELKTPALADVEFSVEYNATTGKLTIPVSVNYALNIANQPLRLFAVVLEDGLESYQDNYMYNVNDVNLGPWGAGGVYGQSSIYPVVFDDVARFATTNNGIGEVIPETSFTAGQPVNYTISATIPSGYIDNPEKCKVVVMAINGADNTVVNSNIAKFGASGVESINPDETDANAEVEYYDLNGRRVNNPANGIYIRRQGSKVEKVAL